MCVRPDDGHDGPHRCGRAFPAPVGLPELRPARLLPRPAGGAAQPAAGRPRDPQSGRGARAERAAQTAQQQGLPH